MFRIVVHALVFDPDGRVLLLRRANTGFLDGHYSLPGGHCDENETVMDAARRECLEEACVTATILTPCLAMPFHGGVDFIFEATRWHGEAAIGEPEKSDDLVWAHTHALPHPTAAFVEKALELRRQGVWYHQFNG